MSQRRIPGLVTIVMTAVAILLVAYNYSLNKHPSSYFVDGSDSSLIRKRAASSSSHGPPSDTSQSHHDHHNHHHRQYKSKYQPSTNDGKRASEISAEDLLYQEKLLEFLSNQTERRDKDTSISSL